MGNGATKEEKLYQAVQNGNISDVKMLCRDGASLESVDKEGRTPLILACTRGDLYDMVSTLLNLGANINTYRPGSYGGVPLHHAAKRGLDKTVLLLLSRGADPLAVNDENLTPLDLARNRGHVSVVRIIEDRICLFSGMLRELSGLGILEALIPQLVTKNIWAVVLPTKSDPRRAPKLELVIYQSPKVGLWTGGGSAPLSHASHAAGVCNVALPRTIISLAKAEFEEPKFSTPDPILIITDKNTRTKYKFLAEMPGDKAQLERFYKACEGIQEITIGGSGSGTPSQGLSGLSQPTTQQFPPAINQEMPPGPSTSVSDGSDLYKLKNQANVPADDVALKMAILASLRTASEEGNPVNDSMNLGVNPEGGIFHGSGNEDHSSELNMLGSTSSDAGPSHVSEHPGEGFEYVDSVPEVPTYTEEPTLSAPPAPPSAPPLPAEYVAPDGQIRYPSIDTSPIEINYSSVTRPEEPSTALVTKTATVEGKESQCVICWDAPAQGVCIPCGHLAGCMDCLSEIKAKDWGCPVCRASIEQVIRVYAV